MKVDQLSVFLENRSGRLAEVADTLGKAGVNIRALSLADTSDFGILRFIVNDTAKALAALKAGGFTVGINQVVAAEVPDRPGGLAGILMLLSKVGLNVEYMYAFVERSGANAIMIFRFEDPERAIAVLGDNGIKVLDGKVVASL
jgi:hypothetical protein